MPTHFHGCSRYPVAFPSVAKSLPKDDLHLTLVWLRHKPSVKLRYIPAKNNTQWSLEKGDIWDVWLWFGTMIRKWPMTVRDVNYSLLSDSRGRDPPLKPCPWPLFVLLLLNRTSRHVICSSQLQILFKKLAEMNRDYSFCRRSDFTDRFHKIFNVTGTREHIQPLVFMCALLIFWANALVTIFMHTKAQG